MSQYLKTHWGTDEGQRLIKVPKPRTDISQDELKAAMEAILASSALNGVTSVIKGEMYTSDTELIYEA